MKFLVEIECSNNAFQPDPQPEIYAVLAALADMVADSGILTGTLKDGNGNRCGKFWTEDGE